MDLFLPHTADFSPADMLGFQAIVGTVWWLVISLYYIKNRAMDANITNLSLTQTVPIGWWWERLVEKDGKYLYISLALLFNWMFYLLVSVVELIAWIFYMHGSMQFAKWYFTTIGWYGSFIGYLLPWPFAIA